MFIWGHFMWTKCLIGCFSGINTVHVSSLWLRVWIGPVFANVLTWPDGTCWRRRHRWMNDPFVSLIKDWWHNPVSLYLFLSLVVFLFLLFLPVLLCHSCSARWQDACVSVCLQCVSQSELVSVFVHLSVSFRVCLLMCLII